MFTTGPNNLPKTQLDTYHEIYPNTLPNISTSGPDNLPKTQLDTYPE